MGKIIVICVSLFLLSGCSMFVPKAAILQMENKNINPGETINFSYTDMSAIEALELLQTNSDLIIIDVSSNYAKGHLPGSINFYIGDGSLDQAIPNLSQTSTYLVYCHVDSASILGAQKMVNAGFMNVYRLIGNYSNWVKLGYPVEIVLQAVNNYSGNGLALRSYYNNKFEHIIWTELPVPMPGKFYEGWLVKTEPNLEFFSTGKLTKTKDFNEESVNMYTLYYSGQENKLDFKQIVITSETEANGLDNKPETHILEAKF